MRQLRILASRQRELRLRKRPWLSTDEYVRRFGAKWHPAEPAAPIQWTPPRRFGSRTIDFSTRLPLNSPEFGVLELNGGSILGTHGRVIGLHGILLPELSWYTGPNDNIRVPRRLPAPLLLQGTCLSLLSDWSCRNYSHYLLDGLGRLGLFLKSGLSLSDIDYVCCPSPPSTAAATLLDRLGIPPEKRISAAPDVLIYADVLFVPSFPAPSLVYQPWLPRFLRQAVGFKDSTPGTRRLYVTRRGFGRRPVAEGVLQQLLQDRHFEIYDAQEHPTQPDDFDDAAVVVGAHGAALANLAFCRPGTKVLELIPTDNAYPFYFSLSAAGGLRYSYLAGLSTETRPPNTFGPSPYDFDIKPDEFEAALDELLHI
jgi:Glycosyltransferase 61